MVALSNRWAMLHWSKDQNHYHLHARDPCGCADEGDPFLDSGLPACHCWWHSVSFSQLRANLACILWFIYYIYILCEDMWRFWFQLHWRLKTGLWSVCFVWSLSQKLSQLRPGKTWQDLQRRKNHWPNAKELSKLVGSLRTTLDQAGDVGLSRMVPKKLCQVKLQKAFCYKSACSVVNK